jgi:hypothetical protein
VIYEVDFSPEFVVSFFITGALVPSAEVGRGLPEGSRLFNVFPSRSGTWTALFEGPPGGPPETEGVVEHRIITFKRIPGDEK